VDGRALWPSHDVERNSLVHVAAEALHFEIEVASINASPSIGDGCAEPQ
jgi:hypothetical protein